MSYLVLARKYRSRRFAELVGQEHVVQALVNALGSGRLHHAWLFTGTRGVGKTSIARILAKALDCTGPDGSGGITAEPCNVCASCRDIDAGRHVDYVELDAASNRGVEEITQLLDQAIYKPVAGRFKIYLIDEVHMLSGHAFNAMLKTLEEPPEYLKFILATTDPQKVPPTVLSRCLQFNLRPMAIETMQEHLRKVLDSEAVAAEPAALRLLARAARGSMRDALSLADQAIAYGAGRLEADAVRQMLGAVDRGHAVRVLDALVASDGAALVAAADGLRALGLSASGLLDEMLAMLQQMAVFQAVPDAGDESDPEAPALARLAAALPADETQLCYGIALRGREELGLAPDEYSGLVMVLLRMLAFRPGACEARPRRARATVSNGQAVAEHAGAGDGAGVAAAPAHAAAAGADAAPPSGPHADRWAEVVRQLVAEGAITALARELALQSQCVAIETMASPETWRLVVEREALRAPAQRDKLQAALAALLGRPVRLELEAGRVTDSTALRDAAERQRLQAEAEHMFDLDPVVIDMKRQFETARIVPGSVKPISSQEQQR